MAFRSTERTAKYVMAASVKRIDRRKMGRDSVRIAPFLREKREIRKNINEVYINLSIKRDRKNQ